MFSEFTENLIAAGGVGGFLLLCFAMFIGHALADYPLQGSFLAAGKNRNGDCSIFFGGSAVPKGLWIHALTAHALIHAGAIWVVTGSATLSVAEFFIHWIIDFIRCEDRISFTTDQLLHYSCKIVYAALLVAGIVMPF